MAEIGPRKKRTVQEPLWEPSREPVRRRPAPKDKPQSARKEYQRDRLGVSMRMLP